MPLSHQDTKTHELKNINNVFFVELSDSVPLRQKQTFQNEFIHLIIYWPSAFCLQSSSPNLETGYSFSLYQL